MNMAREDAEKLFPARGREPTTNHTNQHE
jgi:hypothetical protein